MLPMYFSTLVGAVLTVLQVNSSGVSSMNLVWHLPASEGGVVQNVQNERDVGLDAADVNFVDGAGRLVAHAWKVVSQVVTFSSRES